MDNDSAEAYFRHLGPHPLENFDIPENKNQLDLINHEIPCMEADENRDKIMQHCKYYRLQ